ncbi:MAG TPA: tetratricopeptide repeat protein [Terriglobales bacterium]|nr:tetratricopeptide repeat protein [Terriglobales bacterium]
MRIQLAIVACALLFVGTTTLPAQTFEINGQSQPSPAAPHKKGQRQVPASQGIGWGASIQVARVARAAQDAMRRGDYAQAADFAQRAANAAPQDADLWFAYGYAARMAGREAASVEAYNHGLQLRPSSIQGLSGLAQTYVRMGKTAEAQQLLQRVIAANPRSANDLLLAGELFLDSGDAQKALPMLQRGDALHPSARGELLLAKTYLRLNQPDKAQHMLQRAKNRAPNDPDVLRAVAGFYRDNRDYKNALATLLQVRQRTPSYLAELAYTYQLAGQIDNAAHAYVQAANAQPKQLNLQISAAQALVNDNQLPQAKQFLDRAAGIDPNHYRIFALRGDIARLQGQIPQAITQYQEALRTVPQSPQEGVLYPIELRMTLAQLYRDDNNEAAAEQQAQLAAGQISQINMQGPQRPEFLRLRAAIGTDTGKLQAAEKDMSEALSLDPRNSNISLQYASLLWKMGRKQDSRQMYLRTLQGDPSNRYALISLGYLLRDLGDPKGAQNYLLRAAKYYPNSYEPYLGLGDLFTALSQFPRALQEYEKAYKLNQKSPLIVAGGANASLESHQLPLAKTWLGRAQGNMNQNPEVMREHERYLTWTGNYAESAKLGWQVIQKLPRDREAPVYLAYDLLYMGQYDNALRLAEAYQPILPREKDLWLIAGYVHTHSEMLTEAVDDFSHALELDPNMATGLVNRGFVLNDTQNAHQAAADFVKAIRLKPDYGEAHLGLAYANLQLHHPAVAVKETKLAERYIGDSKATHLALAGAYRQQLLLPDAVKEYRAALKFAPEDLPLHFSLAETLYHMRHYRESIDALNQALALSPQDPFIYAQLAHNYARLHDRPQTFRYIEAAERSGGDQTGVLLATGDALLTLGDRNAAMERFARALTAPDAQRVEARLAIARVFASDGQYDDARQQVSLGFAEARIGEAEPITSDDLVQAANVFLQSHDYDLARQYLQRAKLAGADATVIAIGMANADLAQGRSQSAQAELASLGNSSDYEHNFDYMMAQANVYRQRQNLPDALMAFAQADSLALDDSNAERSELDVAGQEGRPLTPNVNVLPHASFQPIFEDINIYQLDAKLLAIRNPALLPTPRHSFETKVDAGYKLHIGGLPTITGFTEERNDNGTLSFPSELLIQHRNTFDTTFNTGINPVLHLGSNTIVLNPGVQFTVRRDTEAPLAMNQNLFRQFVYLSTSSFFNWISVQGSFMREAGPFTQVPLHSRELRGTLGFTVGRPWGRTSLFTEYSGDDLLFRPRIVEFYETGTRFGVQHKFGDKLTFGILGDYLRAWRVEGSQYALAQALRPGFRFHYQPTSHWSAEGEFAYSRGQGMHFYDNVESRFLVSYVKPVRQMLNSGNGDVPVAYPFRISFGVQQQEFYNLSHGATIVPVVQVSLF